MTLASLSVDDSGLRPVAGIEDYPLEFYNFSMMYFKDYMTEAVSDLHLEYAEAIKYRHSAIGSPRHFAKSVWLSCCYPIFAALKESGSQWVIISATQFLAQNQIMQSIRTEL